ncbi:MAG: hypothetical protein HGA63_06895, partial [Syntrophobacteraceae bacterium]|nr:hypothetical protein [Syntrophobacteraceae bacterium]
AGADLSDGQWIGLSTDEDVVEVRLRTTENMARGTLVLPRHRRLEWRKFTGLVSALPLERVVRVPKP